MYIFAYMNNNTFEGTIYFAVGQISYYIMTRGVSDARFPIFADTDADFAF